MADHSPNILIRVLGPIIALGLTLVLLYLSRFWIWVGPWSTDGLFGQQIISPFGNMINFWLRGTWWQTFDILIWGCLAFLLLSVLQRLAGLFSR